MNKWCGWLSPAEDTEPGPLPLRASLDRATTEEVGLVPPASRWRQRLPVSARGHLPCPCWSHGNPRAEPELGPELRSGGALGLPGGGGSLLCWPPPDRRSPRAAVSTLLASLGHTENVLTLAHELLKKVAKTSRFQKVYELVLGRVQSHRELRVGQACPRAVVPNLLPRVYPF